MHGEDNTALKESISVGEDSLFKMHAKGGLENAVFLYSAEHAVLEGTAGNGSVWYSAGSLASVSGTAGYGAKIMGNSFSGTGTRLGETAFYKATISGTMGLDAQVSGCPLESVTRTSLNEMIQKEVLPRLEQRIKILTKSIQSSFVVRNNIIENAIQKISFKEGGWSMEVSEEQVSAIQKRLDFLLSDAFRLTTREGELKMAYRFAVETGRHAEIRHASNVLDEEKWRNHFKELQANPKVEVRRLEEFRKREILEKKENWTFPDNKGNPGVSEELASYVIQKIQGRMASISKNMSEDAKSLALLDLLAVFSRIQEERDHPKNIPGIQSFHHAKYANITGEFFSKTLPILIGQSETERVHRDYLEQEEAKKLVKKSFFPWKK